MLLFFFLLGNHDTLRLVRPAHLLNSVARHGVRCCALAVLAREEGQLGLRARVVVDRADGREAVVVAAVLGDELGLAGEVGEGVDGEGGDLGVCQGDGLNGGGGEEESGGGDEGQESRELCHGVIDACV